MHLFPYSKVIKPNHKFIIVTTVRTTFFCHFTNEEFVSSFSSLLVFLPLLISCDERHVYIVYFGEHDGINSLQEIEDIHHSHLSSVKKSEEQARASILYSYKNINGFAALLTADEAKLLSEKDEVVSISQSKPNTWSLQTTRSWEFIGLQGGMEFGRSVDSEMRGNLWQMANYGKDVIVGLLDSGIWPESRSFNDEGFGPVPKSWKGICQAGDSFNSSHCNRKLIGARYYLKAYEHYYKRLNKSLDYRSPRDSDSHGTHTSSTVGGRMVANVSGLGGFASGTASGGAPLVRLAMYKVCWPIPTDGSQEKLDTCQDADMLAAIDDAIGDGVDVLSISIGSDGQLNFTDSGIAMGALHAIKKNIVVACAGGNNGPDSATVSNLAPWFITVGASSIDRTVSSPVVLGNGMKIKGESGAPDKLKKIMYPLVYAGDVVEPFVPKNSSAGQCLSGSLSPKKTKGKIVLCMRGEGLRVAKGEEVKRAGGVGMILGNGPSNGDELTVDAHVLPATAVGANDATTILNYIKSSNKSVAQIDPAVTLLDAKPAPSMAAFSSVGPNPLVPDILKPDITAPGLNIIAAWSEVVSPTTLDSDHRAVKYSFESGTSMACPHLAGIAALVKAIHPTWSSAAIRSALMTTATLRNNLGKVMTTEESGKVANPFNFGSGHVRPTKVSDPGLVYDASYTDYLLFLCSIGIKGVDRTFHCPKVSPSVHDLNYPSLAISKLNGSLKVKRTVTNVGGKKSVYIASVRLPRGFSVKLHPKKLYFNDIGEKQSFTITVKAKGSKKESNSTTEEYSFGSYTWKDGIHAVRSPIALSRA
ncbi:hypothetical protein IFM89_013647 [Coptis chinensis]|uniref:Uncharacterized protein n=1 Tax=Coptis chinensis TaxID=261450 RepID=A0A835MEB2_9MAGN|nr:hypothetical protein IFM89_013647 [Coptis chinensis]